MTTSSSLPQSVLYIESQVDGLQLPAGWTARISVDMWVLFHKRTAGKHTYMGRVELRPDFDRSRPWLFDSSVHLGGRPYEYATLQEAATALVEAQEPLTWEVLGAEWDHTMSRWCWSAPDCWATSYEGVVVPWSDDPWIVSVGRNQWSVKTSEAAALRFVADMHALVASTTETERAS